MANPIDEVCKAACQYHNDRIRQLQEWRYWTIAAYVTFTGFVYYAISTSGALTNALQGVSPAFYVLLLLHLGVGFISLLLIRLLTEQFHDRCIMAEKILGAWREELLKKKDSEAESLSRIDLSLNYETSLVTPVSRAQSWFFLVLIFGDVLLMMLALKSECCDWMCWVVITVAVALLFSQAGSWLTNWFARRRADKR